MKMKTCVKRSLRLGFRMDDYKAGNIASFSLRYSNVRLIKLYKCLDARPFLMTQLYPERSLVDAWFLLFPRI